MSKLVPLSSKKMKEMGIVKSKNGFLMQPVRPSKPVSPTKPIKESNNKPERYDKDKAPRQHVEQPKKNIEPPKKYIEQPKQSTNNNSSVSRVERKQESQRLSDRGVY